MSNENRFGSTAFDPSLAGLLRFETAARIGRLLSPRLRKPGQPLLHIGCGATIAEGFDNIDFYAMRFWKVRHIGHDLRQPLPYADQVFDGAFSEHALEHFTSSSALGLLRQVHRVLKPGAVFRISVPSLRKYIDFYEGKRSPADFSNYANGCEAIWSLTQYWGHLSCWDADMLVRQLQRAGFRSAAETAFREGADARLWLDQAAREWESLYVEAVA